MAFQSTVSLAQGFGVPGDFYDDSPRRVQPYVLNSVSAANNIFGNAFSITAEGVASCGNTASFPFAGILIGSKDAVSLGTTGNALAPTLTVPNGTQVQCCTEGSVIVTLPAAAAIGDLVVFDNTTGALSTITPSTILPSGKSPAYASVDRFVVSGAGLAVITLTPSLTYKLS